MGGELRFDYPAKSGQRRIVTIGDPEVAEVVRALKRRRGGGPELLAYKDERGRWVDVRSSDINEYLQEALGPDFSAKDFRTWAATVLAAVALAAEEADGDGEPSEAQRHRAVVRVVRGRRRAARQHPGRGAGLLRGPPGHRAVRAGRDGGRGRCGLTVLDDDTAALDGVAPELLAEIEAAVVALIERGGGRRRG